MKKTVVLFLVNIKNLKILKYIFYIKHKSFLLFAVSLAVKMKRCL